MGDKTTRRRFLRRITAGLGFLSGAAGLSFSVPSAASVTTLWRFRAPVVALRFINTVQAALRRDTGHYFTLQELIVTPKAQEMLQELRRAREAGSDLPVPDTESFLSGGDLVPGYATTYQISETGLEYKVFFVEKEGRDAYKSDQNGVIYEGLVDSGGDPRVAFNGSPIVPPDSEGQHRSAVARFTAAMAALFVPTLHAQAWKCCWFNCEGFCSEPGPCVDVCYPANCCNLGYLTCTWCCGAHNCYFCQVNC